MSRVQTVGAVSPAEPAWPPLLNRPSSLRTIVLLL